MKIIFITESYYPLLGGVPIVVKYLAEGLVQKGYEVTVLTAIERDSQLINEDEYHGVKIERFHLWRNMTKRLCGDIGGIRKYLLNHSYDVVIVECGQASTTDAVLPVLGKVQATKIFHSHGLSGLQPSNWFRKEVDFMHTIGHTYNKLRMKYYYGCWFKRYCKFFDSSICLTEVDSGYDYVCNNIPPTYLLGNAADSIFFEPANSKFEKPWGNKPYILSIANYIPLKGQIEMVRQFYKTDLPNYALVMIGSQKNDYYEQVSEENNKLAKVYGTRPVFMLTGVDRNFFPDILDGASLYLVASSVEVYSISLIEAMARGVPFVSTNVGNACLLPGGVVVDDVNHLHTAMEAMLLEDAVKREYGKKAKGFAYNNCRIETVVNKLESIIKEVMNNNDVD